METKTTNSTKTKQAVSALAALAQATRLSIFRLLIEAGPAGMSPGDIARSLDIAAPTLSFHLKELVHAGLVGGDPRGRFIVYRADFDAIETLIRFLTENCCRASAGCGVTAAACEPCIPAPAARKTSPRRPAPSIARRPTVSTRRAK